MREHERHLRLLLKAAAILLLLVCGTPMLMQAVVDGFHALQYRSLSMATLGNFPFDDEHGILSDIPASKRALNGQRISITGKLVEIPAANRIFGDTPVSQFWLMPDSWPFGDVPLVQQRCLVNGLHDQSARYPLVPVRVDGRLRVSETRDDGYVIRIFSLDADRVTPVPGTPYTRARLIGMTLGLLLLALCPVVTWFNQRQRKRGLCVHCGYDLRASPDRCPECGRHAITGEMA